MTHWILPLYKKKSPWDPGNYRGVHLTSQVGKTVERLLQLGFGTYLSSEECAGENQFAYRKERGARDLLALLVLTWLQGFDQGRKFCLYCSDVSGAFDRVKTTRLTKKLQAPEYRSAGCNFLCPGCEKDKLRWWWVELTLHSWR